METPWHNLLLSTRNVPSFAPALFLYQYPSVVSFFCPAITYLLIYIHTYIHRYSMSTPSGNNMAIDFLLSRLRKILPEVASRTGTFESAIQKYQIDLTTESGQAVAKVSAVFWTASPLFVFGWTGLAPSRALHVLPFVLFLPFFSTMPPFLFLFVWFFVFQAEKRLLQAEEDRQYSLQFSKDLLFTATQMHIVAIDHDDPPSASMAADSDPALRTRRRRMKSTSRFMKVFFSSLLVYSAVSFCSPPWFG
jgi:hypothetical protein